MDGLPSLPTGAGQGSGLDLPRLTPASTLLAHARNRWLHTSLGIWTSTDPNASGQGVIGAALTHGRMAEGVISDLSLDVLFRDGGNLSAAFRSAPIELRDPLGLSALGLFAAAMPGPGDYVRGAYKGLFQGYAENLDSDVEWATDWSQGDDWHSRGDDSWVGPAMLLGIA